MADFPKVDRLKSQLLTSQLSKNDPVLFQVINTLIDYIRQGNTVTSELVKTGGSSGGGSGGGITALTTDVVASGVGTVPAIIQPDAITTPKIIDAAVTYEKIQNTTLADILIGRSSTPGTVEEIELGANLQLVGGTLQVLNSGGTTGLEHNLLSSTHPDTVSAIPILGDIIRAVEGPEFVGEYYGFTLNAPIVEDFVGIRFGYTFNPAPTSGNYFAYYPPALVFETVTPPDTLLAWGYIDFFLVAKLVEDFTGIRFGYNLGNAYVSGNNFAYYPPQLAFVAPINPEVEIIPATWKRLGIGTENQVLTIIDGIPEWSDAPTIPTGIPWVDIPFNAADFTAAGGTTPGWTVSASNVIRWQIQKLPGTGGIGNVRIALYIANSSVTGSGPTSLIVNMPVAFTGKWAQYISIRENGNVVTNTYLVYDNATYATQVVIQKVGGGAFDVTPNETYLSFELSIASVAGIADWEGLPVVTPIINANNLIGTILAPTVVTSSLTSLGIIPQIVFPATQVPSAGANTLDDYEEGTFTPSLTFGGLNVGITYSGQTGYYVKVGRVVHVSLRITLTSKGSSVGSAFVQGLPFTHDGGVALAAAVMGFAINFTGLTGMVAAFVTGTSMSILQWGATGVASISNTTFTNTTDFLLTANYRTTD